MSLDAVIISDYGADTFSGISHMRLELDGRLATIQVIANFLRHQGKIIPPIEGDDNKSWASAPKLNGIYLLDFLTKQGFDVDLIDSYYEERDQFRKMLNSSPKTVIISTTFISNKSDLRKLVDDIRSLAPGINIIVGGQFVYLSYLLHEKTSQQRYDTESAKGDYLFLDSSDDPPVDLCIISPRGERTLAEALTRIRKDRPVDDLPNTAHLVGKSYSFAKRVDDFENAGEVSVDWQSLPKKIFDRGVVPVQASIGCPYKCSYCNFVKDPRQLYVKPVDQLITELKSISAKGVQYVRFVDDNFRLGNNDINMICQRLIDENIQIKWISFIRASALKHVDYELLKRSGCIEVQMGLESSNQQILSNMNKKANPELYSEVIQKLLKVGINCSCCFVFGFPGETQRTVRQTQDFIKSIEHPELQGTLTWSLFPFVLVPLSPIYKTEMREKYALKGYMRDWEHRTMTSKEAIEHTKSTYFNLDDSGPICRGDNLDMLFDLSPVQRKQFVTNRHRLSKLADTERLQKEVIRNGFSGILF